MTNNFMEEDALKAEIEKRLEKRNVVKTKIMNIVVAHHLSKYEAINILDELSEFVKLNFKMSGGLK